MITVITVGETIIVTKEKLAMVIVESQYHIKRTLLMYCLCHSFTVDYGQRAATLGKCFIK